MADNRPLVFDLDVAVKRCMGKYELFQEIAGYLFNEADPLLEQMRSAAADGNADALFRAAHRLKNTVNYTGSGPALETLSEIERMGHHEELDGASEAIETLGQQLGDLKAALVPHRKL
jgi:HPt (histidine-containing phosphotransfer) domain-containing protein